MKSKEAQARIRINKFLEESGWRFFDNKSGKANIILENNVKLTEQALNEFGEDFEKAMVGFNKNIEKEILDSDSIFTFSKINESIIFRFLKIVGCDNSEIGNFTRVVKDRNAIAHSNGNIFYNNQKSIDEKINEILDLLNKIQILFKNIIEENYKYFLMNNEDSGKWEFSEVTEELNQILILKNKLSKEDIRFCLDLDVTGFKKKGSCFFS